MHKPLLTLLLALIFFCVLPYQFTIKEPKEILMISSAWAEDVLVLDEIEVLEFPGTSLPEQLSIGTTEISLENKQHDNSWGWAEVGQTLQFSYPMQISEIAPGEFIADAFGGYLWNENELYQSYLAQLRLEIKGDVWDFSPECTDKKEMTKFGSEPGVNNISLHLNSKCSFDQSWWIDDEAVFGFTVTTLLGDVIWQSFTLRLKYRKNTSSGPFSLFTPTTGSGSGTVTSSPAGITCGADCSEQFSVGTLVTLTATPSPGATFDGWFGGGCSGTGNCKVIMNNDLIVSAAFSKTVSSGIIPVLPLLLRTAILPGLWCGTGKVYDCAHTCVEEELALSFIGDTICDDGSTGFDLLCEEFLYDGFDCWNFKGQ